MATTRFIDHLLEGDHASRPAAGDVPEGTLYSCTTHSLVYQSDTSTWTTWATLGGSSSLDAIIAASSGEDIADALAGANAPDAGNVFATMADVGGGGGGLVLLEEHTASSSATLDFTTRNVSGQSGATFQSDYDDYLFELLNLIPATNNVDFYTRVSVNGGSSFDSSANYSNVIFAYAAGSSVTSGGAGQTEMRLRNSAEIDSNSNGGITGTAHVFYPGSTAGFRRLDIDASYLNGDPIHAHSTSEYTGNTGTAINAIRFFMSSGNITSGIIRAYGFAK